MGAVNEGEALGIITEGETVGVDTEGIVVEATVSELRSAGTASGWFTSNKETYSRSYKLYCSSYLFWNKASCSYVNVKVFVEGDSAFPTELAETVLSSVAPCAPPTAASLGWLLVFDDCLSGILMAFGLYG